MSFYIKKVFLKNIFFWKHRGRREEEKVTGTKHGTNPCGPKAKHSQDITRYNFILNNSKLAEPHYLWLGWKSARPFTRPAVSIFQNKCGTLTLRLLSSPFPFPHVDVPDVWSPPPSCGYERFFPSPAEFSSRTFHVFSVRLGQVFYRSSILSRPMGTRGERFEYWPVDCYYSGVVWYFNVNWICR